MATPQGNVPPGAASVKLLVDEETGEMVSKNELRKRQQKRARKAAQAEARTKKPEIPNDATPNTPKNARSIAQVEELDPEAMFKQGFLADVYRERPSKEVLTRFPPEPNGFLHLGHAKAIAINFGFARYHGGRTNLRFDDTNPSGEKEVYFLAIEEAIRWLGFKPDAVTYSSDNFQKLYDLAEELIKLGKAYVCHCQSEELKRQHGGEKGREGPRYRCEHSEQDPDTNLTKFRGMRDGKYPPKAAFLRMKQDITNPNPQMWDVAAYRITQSDKPHYKTEYDWKMYPTYDFAHCLCDSFEKITHSLCTTEFLLSRESYEWLNTSLGVYEPMQREYGRLNITGAVMSKRIISALVDSKMVKGWDDPRLYTLAGLRRRGIPPGAILNFVNELGVTTALTVIQTARLEQTVRRYLETTVPRLMLVLDPIPVILDEWEGLEEKCLQVPFSPKDPEMMGSHQLSITETIYIDRSDFQVTYDRNFFRLSPGNIVGLLNFPKPIKATSFKLDESSGLVTEIHATFDKSGAKPKAYIQWVPEGSKKVEARIFSKLFRSDNPKSAAGGILDDFSTVSEVVHESAMIEDGFDQIRHKAPWPETASEKENLGPESVRFQAIRIGYFAMDSDSTDNHYVFNRIVALKEDPTKA